MVDFYRRLWKGAQFTTDKSKMTLARWLTVVYGLVVVTFAFQVYKLGTLVEATNKAIGLAGGPLLGMFILGMTSKRATARGTAIGWAAGVATAIKVCFYSHISFLWYSLSGFVVTLAVGWLASHLFPAPAAENLDGLTWETRYQEAPRSKNRRPEYFDSAPSQPDEKQS